MEKKASETLWNTHQHFYHAKLRTYSNNASIIHCQLPAALPSLCSANISEIPLWHNFMMITEHPHPIYSRTHTFASLERRTNKRQSSSNRLAP